MSDRNVLSNDEVEALVLATREGRLATEQPAPQGARGRRHRVRAIDFSRPTKFTQEQQRRLARAHEDFCRLLATRLSAELRLAVDLDVLSLDQLTWYGGLTDLPDPSISGILELSPLGTRMLMTLEMGLIVRLIDRLLGGNGLTKVRPQGLTEIETVLARRVFSMLLDQLSATWEETVGLTLALHDLETAPSNANLAPPSEPALRLTIEVKIERFSSTLTLMIPYRAIEPVASKLAGGTYGEQGPDPHSREAMVEALSRVEVEVQAEAARVDLSIEEVLALEAGSTVPLGPAGVGTLCVGGVPVYRVRPGRNGARRAVAILGLLGEDER